MHPAILAIPALLALAAAQATAADPVLAASTWFGADGDEQATAAAYQPDGTLVVAGVFGVAVRGGTEGVVPGATPASPAAVVRLSPDGRSIRSVTRLGDEVFDLAVDGRGHIHVAAGAAGYIVLGSDGALLRQVPAGYVRRVDAGVDGSSAILIPSVPGEDTKPGAGTIRCYAPAGAERGSFAGHRNTLDLCLDTANGLVITIGWRQDNAHDGKRKEPVQIAYLRGTGLDGATRWTGYDWPVDTAAPGFINASTNNMADTRGYRVALGLDGRAYAAFEVAGGNHIFRWSPTDIRQPVKVVGGDPYHSWHNTKSEHKTFIARFDGATGAYLAGQQLCARLENGKGSAMRVKNGAIAADAAGRVYVSGASASGLPLTYDPLPEGAYSGGAYLLVLTPTLDTRALCTRLTGGGTTQAIALRPDGSGFAIAGTAGADLHALHPLQPAFGGGKSDAFAAVFGATGPIAR